MTNSDQSSSHQAKPKPLSEGKHHVAVMPATALPFGDGILDYHADIEVTLGQIVMVPLGSRQLPGVVMGAGQGQIDIKKIKSISSYADLPPLDAAMLDYIKWVADWTLSPQGAVLKMVLPISGALTAIPSGNGWLIDDQTIADANLTPKRAKVIESLRDLPPMTTSEAAELAAVSPSTITAMGKAGLLQSVEMMDQGMPRPSPQPTQYELSQEQTDAAQALRQAVRHASFAPFVLDGVTGSGKTEVYFDAISAVLEQDKQALILLPEIALSPAMQTRFTERFGAPPVIWHSGLTPRQRARAYRSAAEGGARVIIGARSALFLPYPDLGLIVVDEEHDQSFKQDDHVPYHARDMAVVRAKMANIPVVLASATPSLETEVNIDQGRYTRLRLTERVGTAQLPHIELVDLRHQPPERQHWIAPPLLEAIDAELKAGNQALLFLNRRGFAPLTLCRTCGDRITCPHCSAWLVTHKRDFAMHCHHCGHKMPFPDQCPSCETEASLVPCGPGVERLADEAQRKFPDARVAVLSSDLMTTPQAMAAFTEDVTNGVIDIIVGTQMVAKGHHFPKLKLVGVVDADLGLAGGDLRAAENTWQMMVQVAGRAGRTGERGRAILQTVAPDTPVFKALQSSDRAAFLEAEKTARSNAEMPPYGRLASITLSGRDEKQVAESAAQMGQKRPNFEAVSILGPAAAPIAYLRGRHRYRFLIKTNRQVNIQKIIKDWLKTIDLPSSIRCQVDIDPYQFL